MIEATLKIFMLWTLENMLREVIVGFLNLGSRRPNPQHWEEFGVSDYGEWWIKRMQFC